MRQILFAILMCVIWVTGSTAQTKVANFKDDFSLNPSSLNWKYYWNKPNNWQAGSNPGDLFTGEIGTVSSYTPLISNGSMLTADGDDNGGNSSPDAYIRLNSTGGHTGGTGTNTKLDRYAICAYTVRTPGNYYILNSSLSFPGGYSNGGLVYVHVNTGNQVLSKEIPAVSVGVFDVFVGNLVAGDVIYVCIGANGQSAHDSFNMNFDISIVDQQASTKDYYVSNYGALGNGFNNDMNAIQNAVRDFANDPFPARLHFENKTYKCTGGGIVFDLNGVKNKTILGNGAELIVEPDILGLQIKFSENVLVKDLKFDSDPLSWTQGKIKAIDAANKKFTLEIDNGYPIPTNIYSNAGNQQPWGMIWEPVEYTIKNELVFIASSRNVSGNTVELSVQDQNALNNMNVNDRFTVDVFGVGGSFNSISESKNISCQNLSFYATRAVVFALTDNVGLIHMDAVDLRRKPGTNRLLSCYRDGFHCARNTQGPVIENCYIDGLCDDAININSGYNYVTTRLSSTQFVLDNASRITKGDTLLFVDIAKGIELGKTYVASNSGNTITTSSAIEGVVAGAPANPNTTFVMNLSKSNSGFIIRNNTFGGQRRYAMLIRSPNGLIENNTGEKLGAGIVLKNEIVHHFEGPFPRNITIRNNKFTNIRAWPLWLATDTYTNVPQQLVKDIRLSDNVFGPSTEGKAAATFDHVANVELSGNTFVNAVSAGGVALTNSRNIKFNCNNTYNGKTVSLANGIIFGNDMLAWDIAFNCVPTGTSINQNIINNSFEIYPNPAKDKLYFRTDIDSYQLEIIDVYGKRIQIRQNSTDYIDLSGFCQGVYMICITNEGKKLYRKFIKY